MVDAPHFTAFGAAERLASGALDTVAAAAAAAIARGIAPVFVFDDADGQRVDLDFSVPLDQALLRVHAARRHGSARRPDRDTRAVRLLPRHWDWLDAQPGGASAALRRLVEAARRTQAGADRCRMARERTYRVLQDLGGDRPAYEEALRALFAGDAACFAAHLAAWPTDVRTYLLTLAAPAFAPPPSDPSGV